MSTAVLMLFVGAAFAALAGWLSIWRHGKIEPFDPTREKRLLVRVIAGRPRLAAFVRRRLDQTTAGGLLLTVGFIAVLALAVAVGLLFDMVSQETGFARFDQAVAEFGAENADRASLQVFAWITLLGGTPVVALVALVTAAYGLWRHHSWHVAGFIVTVVAGQALINTALKGLVMRDRPTIEQLVAWSGSSFPSGHAAAAAATYAGVALVLGLGRSLPARAGLAAGAALLAGLVAASRSLLGVHWLTDIIAGLAVGWSWFIVCGVAFGARFMRFGEPRDEVAARTIGDVEAYERRAS